MTHEDKLYSKDFELFIKEVTQYRKMPDSVAVRSKDHQDAVRQIQEFFKEIKSH